MARLVHLHAGLPKTGTTFLQTTLWHNRALLRERGLLYPGQQRLDHYNAWLDVRRRRDGGAWDALTAELAAWPEQGLVSHEFFSLAGPREAERVVAALEPAEVHLVLTVRSYVRQFPAVWQEALKMHVDSSFDEFMEDAFSGELRGAWGWASQDVPRVLERWSAAVPPERVTIVTVPPPGSPRDLLWRRWCEAVDLDDTGFDLDVSYPNESLGAQQAAVLRAVKPHLTAPLDHGPTRHRWVRRYLGHEVLVPQGGDRFLPRPEHRKRLLRRSRHAVDAIRDAGYRVVGDLDDLLDTGPAEPGPHPDDVTAEEALEVAVRAIEQMVRDVRELSLENAELRAHSARGRARRVRGLASRAVRRVRRVRDGGRDR